MPKKEVQEVEILPGQLSILDMLGRPAGDTISKEEAAAQLMVWHNGMPKEDASALHTAAMALQGQKVASAAEAVQRLERMLMGVGIKGKLRAAIEMGLEALGGMQ